MLEFSSEYTATISDIFTVLALPFVHATYPTKMFIKSEPHLH